MRSNKYKTGKTKLRRTKFQIDDYVRAKQNTINRRFGKVWNIYFRGIQQIIWMTPIGKGVVHYRVSGSQYMYRSTNLAHVTKQKALEWKLCQ